MYLKEFTYVIKKLACESDPDTLHLSEKNSKSASAEYPEPIVIYHTCICICVYIYILDKIEGHIGILK